METTNKTTTENTYTYTATPTENIRTNALWRKCMHRWPWFLVSVIICLILAVLYLYITPSTYTRYASIIVIEDNKSSTSTSDMMSSLFSNLSVFRYKNPNDTKTSAKREMLFMQSDEMLETVVRRLSLNMNYETDGSFHRDLLYGKTLPVMVQFLDLNDFQHASLTLKLHNGITLEDNGETKPIRLGDTVATNYGRVVVTPSLAYARAVRMGMTIYVTHNRIDDAVRMCRSRLSANMDKEVPSIVDFTYSDFSIERAENVLDTLFAAYAETVARNKRKMADEMADLIDSRIDLLKDELGDVDNDISTYKRDNSMADINDIIKRARDKETETAKQINNINHQLYLLAYLRAFIINPANFGQVLPSNTGIDNDEIEHYIRQHNDKQIERNDWAASITETSPLITDLDIEIANTKKALVELIDNTILAQKAQLAKTEELHNQALNALANTPNMATYLVTVERQKKVKEQIYVYLLQKREENELSQVFSSNSSLVVKAPTGSLFPTAPSYKLVLFIALALGLLIPLLIIWMNEMMYTKVRERKDVEGLETPLVGEIPLYTSQRKIRHSRSKDNESKIVVSANENSSIGEAFRIVRTNIEYKFKYPNMFKTEGETSNDVQHSAPVNPGSKVVMITSANASCGKSFVSANLAATFAIKGTKTICIDLDLRQASMARYVANVGEGICAYLDGSTDNWRNLIRPAKEHPSLNIIPAGRLPLNPVELLSSPRLEQLMNELREEYDMVIVDCPPAEVVADATIIARQADMTIFIVKARLTDLSELPAIDGYYAKGKYPDLTLLLNGTIDPRQPYPYRR